MKYGLIEEISSEDEHDPQAQKPRPSSLDQLTLSHALDTYLFDPHTGIIVQIIPRSGLTKTFAMMLRPDLPSMCAESGWTTNDRGPNYLDSAKWTNRALVFAKALGISLPSDVKDRGVPGRYSACHAEAQLVAYLVADVFKIPHDMNDVNQIKELLEARRVEEEPLEYACIKANMNPCPMCIRFSNALRAYGIEVKLQGPDTNALMRTIANRQIEASRPTSTSDDADLLELESRFKSIGLESL